MNERDVREWLTPSQVAQRLDVCVKTVYRWILSEKLAAKRLAGRRYVIDPAALDALLEPAGRKESPAEEAARIWRERGYKVG